MKISLLFLWCRSATEFGGRPPVNPPPFFAAGNPGPPVNPHRFSRRGTPGHPSRPLAVPEKICVPLPRLYLFFSTAALSSPCFIRPRREPPTLSTKHTNWGTARDILLITTLQESNFASRGVFVFIFSVKRVFLTIQINKRSGIIFL